MALTSSQNFGYFPFETFHRLSAIQNNDIYFMFQYIHTENTNKQSYKVCFIPSTSPLIYCTPKVRFFSLMADSNCQESIVPSFSKPTKYHTLFPSQFYFVPYHNEPIKAFLPYEPSNTSSKFMNPNLACNWSRFSKSIRAPFRLKNSLILLRVFSILDTGMQVSEYNLLNCYAVSCFSSDLVMISQTQSQIFAFKKIK